MSVKCGVKKRCNKNPFRRRMMLLFKWFLGDKKSVSEKYVEAAAGLTGGHGAGKPSPRVNLKNKKTVDILVHDGAKWKNKRWPYVLELATELLKLRKTRVTLTGVKDEVDNSGGLLYHNSRRFKNLVGKTDFAGLLEEIRRTDIFVGNDTAAAHAAALYGKPAIIFLGPTVQAFGFITGRDFIVLENKGLMCRPCHLHGGDKCPIGSFDCMRSISVGSALEAVKKIISRGN